MSCPLCCALAAVGVEKPCAYTALSSLQVSENLALGRQLKAEAQAIEENLVREREEEVKLKQSKRQVVVEARAGIAVAAEKVAAERRAAAEEERRKQVSVWMLTTVVG